MQANKNRFAAAGFDDSDEEVQHVTKTQKKKEERKITDKLPKVNKTAMAEGGFEVTDAPRPQTAARGGRGAARGGERGGNRGGRGGNRGGRGARLDADGNPIAPQNRERRPFTGKPREDAHPMDRQSGTGRGRRAENKRDGHGKGNWGDRADVTYKKKGEEGTEAPATTTPAEETKVEEKKEEPKVEEPKVIIKEEIIGVSIDDYFQNKGKLARAQGRDAEGIKGAKVEARTDAKERQATLL